MDLSLINPVMFVELHGMQFELLVNAEGVNRHSHFPLDCLNINPSFLHIHYPLGETINPDGQRHALSLNTYVGLH